MVVLLVSVVTPILTAVYWGNTNTWPALSTGFAATAIAFLVALAWDRRQREAADHKEALAEARRVQAAKAAEQERKARRGEAALLRDRAQL